MFIQTEQSPDAATMKFFPGRTVLASGNLEFSASDQPTQSPLAERLFQIDYVTAVALGSDFIAVSKAELADWQLIKPMVLGAIMEHFMAGLPVLLGEDGKPIADAPAVPAGEADEIVSQITELLETRVRPAVTQDGGDVIFQESRISFATTSRRSSPSLINAMPSPSQGSIHRMAGRLQNCWIRILIPLSPRMAVISLWSMSRTIRSTSGSRAAARDAEWRTLRSNRVWKWRSSALCRRSPMCSM